MERRAISAFSLVELTLVMAIVAVTAAIVLPRYNSSLARYRADLAARRVAADLALVQAKAKATSSSQTITVTAATGSYQIVGMSDPDRPGRPYIINLAADPFGVTLDSATFGGDSSITFNGFGVPDSGGTITLHVGSVQKTIVVDADTGAAHRQSAGGNDEQ